MMFNPIEQVKAEQEKEMFIENNLGLFMNYISDAKNSKNMEEFKNIFKNLNYYTAVELYKQLEVEEKLIKEKKDRISYVYNITIENENNM